MHRFIRGMLDNDSIFGQIMTRCGIIIAANILFVVFSLPVITAGPALAALYYVMLKVLRGDRELNPFKTFWQGFRMNFRQAVICWLVLIALIAVGAMDISICMQAGGALAWVKYATYAIAAAVIIVCSYLVPVMAAFEDTIPNLLRNAVFFIGRRPLKMIPVLFANIVPMAITFLDRRMLPLYAFMWSTFGFAAVAMFVSSVLIKDFEVYLPKAETAEEEAPEEQSDFNQKRTDKQTLEDMKKLGQ